MKNQAFLGQKRPPSHENAGNAIVITLIVIALMGVLTAMLMRSAGRITNNYTNEEARNEAGKLMRSAQDIEGGVSRLTSVNRCGENALDFTNTKTTKNYAHTPVSPDDTCKLYAVDGAGLNYAPPSLSVLDTSKSALTDYGQWVYLGGQCVMKVGTGDGSSSCTNDNLELMLLVRYIRQDVCLEIDKLLKLPAAATSDGIPLASSDVTSSGFVGTFSTASPVMIGDATTGLPLVRQQTGCFKDGSVAGTYTFYHILLSR